MIHNLDPVRDIFDGMRTERIKGVPLSQIVGGGDPMIVASTMVAAIDKYAKLESTHSILDVGCGCGRIAAALTQYIDSYGRYVGVDIVPGLIEFARKFITVRYPHFEFLLLDESNLTYDWYRGAINQPTIRQLTDARPASSIDLAVSVSLFTHLDYLPAMETLKSVYKMVKDNGRAFVTAFVLDDAVRAAIARRQSAFSFSYKTPSGELFAEKQDKPTLAIAYDELKIHELLASTGFKLENWIRGYWSTKIAGESFQDVLILRKDE